MAVWGSFKMVFFLALLLISMLSPLVCWHGGGLQAVGTVVLSPGARNLLYGLASDALPRTVAHCIAWRRQDGVAAATSTNDFLSPEQVEEREAAQQLAVDAARYTKGRMRAASDVEPSRTHNQGVRPRTIPEHSDQVLS